MAERIAPFAMVVDHDALIVIEACEILAEFGFQCLTASEAEEAISVLDDQVGAVILLFSNVKMSGEMDGFALARHVATHWPNVEIVIASGMVMPEAGDMPEKATFISKPFDKHTVRAHLEETMPEHKKPPALRASSQPMAG